MCREGFLPFWFSWFRNRRRMGRLQGWRGSSRYPWAARRSAREAARSQSDHTYFASSHLLFQNVNTVTESTAQDPSPPADTLASSCAHFTADATSQHTNPFICLSFWSFGCICSAVHLLKLEGWKHFNAHIQMMHPPVLGHLISVSASQVILPQTSAFQSLFPHLLSVVEVA